MVFEMFLKLPTLVLYWLIGQLFIFVAFSIMNAQSFWMALELEHAAVL